MKKLIEYAKIASVLRGAISSVGRAMAVMPGWVPVETALMAVTTMETALYADEESAIEKMEPKFLILSTKRGFVGNDCVFYAPNRLGYTTRLEAAGYYSEEEAMSIIKGMEDYLFAIPVGVAIRAASTVINENGANWHMIDSIIQTQRDSFKH